MKHLDFRKPVHPRDPKGLDFRKPKQGTSGGTSPIKRRA